MSDAGDVPLSTGAGAREEIERAIAGVLAAGCRPLALGGDHSVTYPILRAVSRTHHSLTILHLDAHPDLYEEFEGDRFSHACPFARIMEEGLADRLVQVGVRTLNRHQRDQARRFGVELIEMKDWRDGRPLRFDTPVYLTFDLDVLEPGLVPGISHREAGGLTVRQAIAIVQELAGPLVGADLVEFNPANDPGAVTAAVCGKLVKEIAGRMLLETDR
jgi:agmatinase